MPDRLIMTKDLDDQSRVRLSLTQLWTIIVAVAGATFVIAGGLYDVKGEQRALRADVTAGLEALRELKGDRNETLREWSKWRQSVDESNYRQDGELRDLRRTYR